MINPLKRWRVMLALAAFSTMAISAGSTGLMLYGQTDPDIRIGMTLEESRRIAGEPSYEYLGTEISGILVDQEMLWERGLRVTSVHYGVRFGPSTEPFEKDDIRLKPRAWRVEHYSIPLTVFVREKFTIVRRKLGF
jgi:hypothetical protein